MRDFIIQLIGFLPSVIAITSLQSPNRKKILALQFFCNILWLIHYGMLGATTLMATNIIGMLRAVLCYYNDRPWVNRRWIPFGLAVVYCISTALTWQGIASLFPCIAMLLTTVALWSHDMKLTRLLFLINSPFMLLADLLTGSYSTAVIECFAFASFALAVYRYDIRKQNEKESEAAAQAL